MKNRIRIQIVLKCLKTSDLNIPYSPQRHQIQHSSKMPQDIGFEYTREMCVAVIIFQTYSTKHFKNKMTNKNVLLNSQMSLTKKST